VGTWERLEVLYGSSNLRYGTGALTAPERRETAWIPRPKRPRLLGATEGRVWGPEFLNLECEGGLGTLTQSLKVRKNQETWVEGRRG
jgi:hypothetical protein